VKDLVAVEASITMAASNYVQLVRFPASKRQTPCPRGVECSHVD